ncbi:MAG: hypothetical protein ACLUEK_01755 [Oscillospiraceae bacterium]
MCAERRLTSGELDELILKCLADGMGLHRIMQELYGACGVWLAVFDTSSGTIFCVPDGDAGRMDVLERLKRVIVDGFLAGDAKPSRYCATASRSCSGRTRSPGGCTSAAWPLRTRSQGA